MERKTKGQGIFLWLITALFVIASFALVGYSYAQDEEDAQDVSFEDYWADDYLPPIDDVFDERLNERSDDLDHQIDVPTYSQNIGQLVTDRQQEDYTNIYKQVGYSQTQEHIKQGDLLAAVQVYDTKLGKEYLLSRTNDGVNDAVGNQFKIQEVIRDGDNVSYKLVEAGGEGVNLHAEGLQISAGFIKPGEDLSQLKYTDQYNGVNLVEVNRLASMGGRTDTSNAFGIYTEPQPEPEPVPEQPASLTMREGYTVPGGYVMGAGGDARVVPPTVEINLNKDPKFVEERDAAIMGSDQDQYQGIKDAQSRALGRIGKYLEDSTPQDSDDYINLENQARNRQIMNQAREQFGTEGTP